jgi:hypothetical protein
MTAREGIVVQVKVAARESVRDAQPSPLESVVSFASKWRVKAIGASFRTSDARAERSRSRDGTS